MYISTLSGYLIYYLNPNYSMQLFLEQRQTLDRLLPIFYLDFMRGVELGVSNNSVRSIHRKN